MKVLFVTNYGEEHVGGFQAHLIRAFKQMQWQYDRIGTANIFKEIVKQKISTPDFILMMEGEISGANSPVDVGRMQNITKVWWFADTHVIFNQQVELAKMTNTKFLFCAQNRFISRFKDENLDVIWLPQAVDNYIFYDMGLEKEYDIAFVGYVTDIRAKWFEALSQAGLNVHAFSLAPKTWPDTYTFHYHLCPDKITYEEYSSILNKAKIGLHHSWMGDITFRPFEVTGAGAMLLTDKFDSVEALWDVGKEAIIFNDEREMVELAKYYVNSDSERKEIALLGNIKTRKIHKWSDRLLKIGAMIGVINL